jgi:hypothetical protein
MAGANALDPSSAAAVSGAAQARSELGNADSAAVARTVAEVEQLRSFWTTQPTSRDGDLDFYLFILRTRPEAVRPHVITLNTATGPRAMLIGRLETKPLDIRFGYFHLPTPVLRQLIFIDGGVAGRLSAADSDMIMRSIVASLRAGEADVAILEHFDTAHPLAERARALVPRLCADRFTTAHTHHKRTLGGRQPLLATLSANERNNQRRREKRLRQDFRNVRIDCFHQAGDLDRLSEDVEAVARTSYQRGLGVGFVDSPQMRERLAFEAEKGTLRGHVLYVDGKPCAFWIASLYRGVLGNDFMGFDPAYGKYAPGMYLALNVLEEVRCDPRAGADAVVDFGIGEGEWKTRLGNEQRQETSIAVFAPTATAIALNAVRTAAAIADRSARALLRRSQLLPRIKRQWRRRFAG